MAQKGKKPNPQPQTGGCPSLEQLAQEKQLDFELRFFESILATYPDYVDVLRVMSNNLTHKHRYREGLEIDRQLVRLRPLDSVAHYNLACSFALLRKADQALKALERAIELGYRDFQYMAQDKDLDSIRKDPRFQQIIREFTR
jgi:tetratricopeptide (TPR) repeat protein